MRGQLDFEMKHYPGSSGKLLFIWGFGCNDKQPGLSWFIERLLKREYDITCVQLPTDISDFRTQVLDRLEEIEKDLGDHVGIGFSYGGLALSFLFGSSRRIFISPFWGINEKLRMTGDETIATVLSVVPKPLIHTKFETDDAGPLAVDEDLIGIPEKISFRSVHQFFEAHKVLPDPRPNDLVFFSKSDNIVSPDVIEKRVEKFGIDHQLYNGGHIFYLDKDREETMIRILEEIDRSFLVDGCPSTS